MEGLMNENKKKSNAPKVALAWRLYEARKLQLLKEGLPPEEYKKRRKAAATYCGI